MQEVRDLATGMKDAITALRKANADAKASLQAEIARASLNAEKVKALTSGLKDANQEVESFLGITNSNFPPPEEYKTYAGADKLHIAPKADLNGVTLNPEARK